MSMCKVVAIAPLFLLVAGCKKKPRNEDVQEAMVKMGGFADDMCKCQDKACADHVQAAMTKWSTDMAARGVRGRNHERPSDEVMKRMTEIGQRYAECMTKAMSPQTTPVGSAATTTAAGSAVTTRLPPVVASPAAADELIAHARQWGRTQNATLQIAELEIIYVGADGLLDPTDGAVNVTFGRTRKSLDDPKRRTGAPVRSRPAELQECRKLAWSPNSSWWKSPYDPTCREVTPPSPRCTVPAIWQRAIARGAPKDALALVDYHGDAIPAEWTFKITDELRKVSIDEKFIDDCAPIMEKTETP